MNNNVGYEIKINDLCIMNSREMICFIRTSVEKKYVLFNQGFSLQIQMIIYFNQIEYRNIK